MKVNNKFLNIESKSKKSQIEKEIHEFEDEKSKKNYATWAFCLR